MHNLIPSTETVTLVIGAALALFFIVAAVLC